MNCSVTVSSLHSCILRESLMQQSTANAEPDDDYGDYDYESGAYIYINISRVVFY